MKNDTDLLRYIAFPRHPPGNEPGGPILAANRGRANGSHAASHVRRIARRSGRRPPVRAAEVEWGSSRSRGQSGVGLGLSPSQAPRASAKPLCFAGKA